MKPNQYLLISLLTLFYACHSSAPEGSKINTDTIPVKTMVLEKQNSSVPLILSGQFTTDDEVMLSFKTGGIISKVLVKEGDRIKRGQLLATLNLTEISAQVQQARLAFEKAERDYKRTNNLYKDSVATLEQLQNTRTAVQLAQEQLNLASFNRQFSEIHAPQDGFILKKIADAGQQVSSGAAVLQANGQGRWLLRAGISDQEWASLKVGDKARVQIASLPDQVFQGELSRKSEGADASTGTFSVYLTLQGKTPPNIAAGMFGKASVQPSVNQAGNWKIPYEALLDGNGNTGYVFITNDNKTALKRTVTIAGIEKNTVTVTHGLQDAKALIVSGSAYLTDNSMISTDSSLKSVK